MMIFFLFIRVWINFMDVFWGVYNVFILLLFYLGKLLNFFLNLRVFWGLVFRKVNDKCILYWRIFLKIYW